MLEARFEKHTLKFKQPAGTSRGVLYEKDSWLLFLNVSGAPNEVGCGECSIIPGLSQDDPEQIEDKLSRICRMLKKHRLPDEKFFRNFPAIECAWEMARADLMERGKRVLFRNDFSEGKSGILINGLIWMGRKEDMLQRVEQKLEEGFHILKLKVGAIDFQEELDILQHIRSRYSGSELELRLDANGAWTEKEASEKLKQLSEFEIHSLEQPIRPGDFLAMKRLCEESPIDIALDEELIGVRDYYLKRILLDEIRPKYVILKPSLLGGFESSEDWIALAKEYHIGWWITSALESNIGLNAIAQWTASLGVEMPQGLGTGGLFENNVGSELEIRRGELWRRGSWDACGC